MKQKKRNVAREIISDLKEFHATLKSGVSLKEKFTVRTVRAVPDPGNYGPALDPGKIFDRPSRSKTPNSK